MSPSSLLRPDFTFSKKALEEACHWWLLPSVPWEDTASSYAMRGRVLHKLMATLVTGGELVLPEDVLERALYAQGRQWLRDHGYLVRASQDSLCEKPRKDGLRPVAGLRAEVAFAYDVETQEARELVDPEGWDVRWYADPAKRAAYTGPGGPIRETEVCGRVDLVCPGWDNAGAFVWIGDFKFHFGGEHAPPPPDARAQLEIGGLAAAKVYGVDRVKATGIHVYETRVDLEALSYVKPDGEVVEEVAPFALVAVAASLDELANAPANDPVPHSGPHCDARYCPARAACPLTAEVVADVLPAESLVRKRSLKGALEDNAHALWARDAGERLIAVGEELVAKAKKWADTHEGIIEEDGQVYAAELVPSESVDLPRAEPILAELGLAAAVERTVTWASVKRAGGDEKTVRAKLRDAKALKTKWSRKYETRPAKREEKAS